MDLMFFDYYDRGGECRFLAAIRSLARVRCCDMVGDDVERASTKGTKERYCLHAEKGHIEGGCHGAVVAAMEGCCVFVPPSLHWG